MQKVPASPEPADFDSKVRVPGQRFLSTRPRPTTREWNTNAHWRNALPELRDRYDGICAYSRHYIPNVGGQSVDHFLPKSRYPDKAFEWSNYRLAFGVINGRKGDDLCILDPFKVDSSWFCIDFPSMLVRASKKAPGKLVQQIEHTILRLGLNDEDKSLKDRFEWTRAYCHGEVTLVYLRSHAPFLAAELERQGLLERIKSIMRFRARP